MGCFGRCTNKQSLSACYLLVSTVLVMLVLFTAEDVLFSVKCQSCQSQLDQVGLLLPFGKSRPLLQSAVADEQGQQGPSEPADNSSEIASRRSEVNKEETESFGAQDRNVGELPEVDSTEKLGTGRAKPGEADSSGEPNSATAPRPVVNPDLTENTSMGLNPAVCSKWKQTAVASCPMVWYYTNVYKHPVATLRKLTEEDGAPPLQSNVPARDRELTIVTQTSADRLIALEATCLTWGGALVVAVHVRLLSEVPSLYDKLKQMHARVEEQSGCRLDMQLVTEDGFETEEDAMRASYPVNALRNVALGMAKTKLIFLLDADFKPSPRLHEILTEDEEKYQDLLRQATEERQLFVVPAFEAVDGNVQRMKEPVIVPETMEDLRERWEKKTIDCFHCRKSPTGHTPTKFETFFNANTTDPYPIVYKDGFEPYVIGALGVIPPYDGRFRGYGENKVSHLYSCAADGMRFQVLPDVFVFELPHPPSAAHETYVGKHKDRDQRYRIIGLYTQFRHEIEALQKERDPDRFQRFLQTSRTK